MFVVTQNRKGIVKIDNALYLDVVDHEIRAVYEKNVVHMGKYKTDERAMQVFEYIANIIGLGVPHIISLPEE